MNEWVNEYVFVLVSETYFASLYDWIQPQRMSGESCYPIGLFCSWTYPYMPRQSVLWCISKYHSKGLFCGKSGDTLVIQAAIMNIVSIGGFSGGWKSKIKLLVHFISGERSLPDCHMATFLLCPHMAERESELSGVSSYKDTNSIWLGSHPYDLI